MDFKYEIVENKIMIMGINQETDSMATDIIIPEELEGMPVTMIGPRAFSDCKEILSITLPDKLEAIEKYAFSECRGLTKIHIPDRVIRIGDHAFYNCRGLEEMTVPGGIEQIGDGALKNCNKLSVVTVIVRDGKNSTVKHLLPDIAKEITLNIKFNEGEENQDEVKLLLPKDNIYLSDFSTRLYMDIRYGVGYHYRLVIGENEVDCKRYDRLFTMACGELAKELLIELAMNRLMFPYDLEKSCEKTYKRYISEQLSYVLKAVIKQEEIDKLQYLMNNKLIHQENIEEALGIAYEEGKTECIGYLLELKHTWSNKRDTVFEL